MTHHLTRLDFQQARIRQVLFQSRLRAVLYGVQPANPTLLSRADNPLGQWLDTLIKPRFGHRPEVEQLEQVLQQQLASAHTLLHQYQHGEARLARIGLYRLDAYTARIDTLLRALEQAVL